MAENQKIDFVVRTAVDTEDRENPTRWREIGVGFKGKNSITVLVDSLPVNGKFVIFPYEPKPKEEKKSFSPFGT